MNIANYLTAVNRAGETGHYPLSTETLAFIQEQIQLLSSSLIRLVGGVFLLKSPTTTQPGAVIYHDELLEVLPLTAPLVMNKYYSLKIETHDEEIVTPEDTYKAARTIRAARVVETDFSAKEVEIIFIGSPAGNLMMNPRYGGANSLSSISNQNERIERAFNATLKPDVPLFTDPTEGGRYYPELVFINDPRDFSGYKPKLLPFYDKGNDVELRGAMVRTKEVGLLSGRWNFGDPFGLYQELTTKDGVVYERYIAPQYGDDVFLGNPWAESRDWHPKPGSILGALTVKQDGLWTVTGIFRYSEFVQASVNTSKLDLKVTKAHRLLAPDKCIIQASAVSSRPDSSAAMQVVWSVDDEADPNYRLQVLDRNKLPEDYVVSVIAIALP